MPCARLVVLVLCGVVLTGCASSYQVLRMPQREADLYPTSQSEVGITIAIDEIKDAARAERYFGANLVKAGILPLLVVVSNYGEHRVIVKPSDVLLHRGSEIIDPLPIEIVSAVAKSERWFMRSNTEEMVDDFFEDLAFRETVLLPNDTYQGVLFFSTPKPQKTENAYFTMLSLFREGGPRVRVGVTDLETRERLHFGPFPLSVQRNPSREPF
jgi:hypothetical protein